MFTFKRILLCVSVMIGVAATAATWQMADDGSIVLSGDKLAGYSDHVEMSGKRVSVVLRYAVQKDGSLTVNKGMVWPMLRTVPNNTHASLMRRVAWDLMDELVINNYRATHDRVELISLKGTLRAESRWGDAAVVREWFPSTEQPAVMELMTVKNLGDKDITKFIDYVASDLCCYNIFNIIEVDDNTFYGSFYDELGDGGSNVTAKFTKVSPEKSAAKKTLTLGGMYIGTDIKKNIILFNRGSDNYRIIVKDYSNNTEDGDYNAMLDAINNDIIAGTMPDIMLLNTSMDISNYFAKGAFEPLDSYMEKDSEFDRSDYMENVLDAMTFDGKLYCITPTFYVNTLVGKKSVVGDKNLSLTELENIAKDMGDNVKVFSSDTTKEQFIRNVMSYDRDEFVDMNTGEVKFDSPEFIKVLEFTDNLPAMPPDYEEDNWEEYEAEFRLNRALVMTMGLYDFRDSMSYYRTVMFGEELGFIGFPTSNGSGNTIGFDNALAISADSQYKDGAWEFIRTYISDDFQDKITYGFPINKAALKKRGQEATKPQTYIDENGKEQVVKESYWLDGKEVEVDPPTQADIDAFIEVLGTADSLVNYNESITNIVLEEASGYFDGQKSAEAVAKVIQSKVQIYVNENR